MHNVRDCYLGEDVGFYRTSCFDLECGHISLLLPLGLVLGYSVSLPADMTRLCHNASNSEIYFLSFIDNMM